MTDRIVARYLPDVVDDNIFSNELKEFVVDNIKKERTLFRLHEYLGGLAVNGGDGVVHDGSYYMKLKNELYNHIKPVLDKTVV